MRQGKLSELIHNSVGVSGSPIKRKGNKQGKGKNAQDEQKSDFTEDEDDEGYQSRGGELNSCAVEVHFREIVDLVRLPHSTTSISV
jgi:hypothetical protein